MANSGIQFICGEYEFSPEQPLMFPDGRALKLTMYERHDPFSQKLEFDFAVNSPAGGYVPLRSLVANGQGSPVMTSPDHPSGTDRLAEVAMQYPDVDVIINVQGDEPMIDPDIIDRLAKAFDGNDELKMATVKVPMKESEYNDPAAVKVVTDDNGYALYFSRSLIPYPRNTIEGAKVFKHVGVYAYRRDFLLQYAALEPTMLEQVEGLEQLRALQNGYKIKVLDSDFQGIGIDTPEDLEAINRLLAAKNE